MITQEAIRPRALDEAVLILVSPLGVLMGLFISPVLLLAWPLGIIMLWASRSWSLGAKLFGTALSGVAFVSGGILGFDFHWQNDGLGATGVAMAVTIFVFLLLLQMAPAIASVIYLWRTRDPRRSQRRQHVGNDRQR
jgi:hypothetical protein